MGRKRVRLSKNNETISQDILSNQDRTKSKEYHEIQKRDALREETLEEAL